MNDRPLLEARELDTPLAEVSRDVEAYLSRLGREHTAFIDQMASSAILLEGRSALARAVSQHRRLTAQFLDAQRAILRLWADVDADVDRLVETANLELALLGADPVTPLAAPVDELDDASLRRSLDSWWSDARRAGSAALEEARVSAARHVHLARLEPGNATMRAVDAAGAPADGERARAADDGGSTAASILAALESADVADLPGMLDALLGRLTEPTAIDAVPSTSEDASPPPAVAPPAVRRVDLTFVDPPAEDAFERFWGGDLLPAGRVGQLVSRALVPLGATVAGLTVLLAWIG